MHWVFFICISFIKKSILDFRFCRYKTLQFGNDFNCIIKVLWFYVVKTLDFEEKFVIVISWHKWSSFFFLSFFLFFLFSKEKWSFFLQLDYGGPLLSFFHWPWTRNHALLFLVIYKNINITMFDSGIHLYWFCHFCLNLGTRTSPGTLPYYQN